MRRYDTPALQNAHRLYVIASGADLEPFIAPQYVCSLPNAAITAHGQHSQYIPQVSLWQQIADAESFLYARWAAEHASHQPDGSRLCGVLLHMLPC